MINIPLHPALVHLPIGLSFAVPLILIFILYGEKKGILTAQSWLLGVFLQLIVAISALIAMKFGENDADIVEQFIQEGLVERHETRGEFFVWGAFALFALLLLSYFLRKFQKIKILSLILSLLFLFSTYLVGHSGGELVYHHGASRAFQKVTE